MVAITSRAALTAPETHDAWVRAYVEIVKSPADPLRAACPNCGRFDLKYQFIADGSTRAGLCALWCTNCNHGHTLSRVIVPEAVEFLHLDGPDEELASAIPAFIDAVSQVATPESPGTSKAPFGVATTLSPREREVLERLRDGQSVSEIARSLSLSRTTIRTHLERAYWKVGHAAGHQFDLPPGA